MFVEILIKGGGNSCVTDGRDTFYFGKGLQYPVHGGKQFLVLRNDCEVLRRKISQILKEEQILQVALHTHCLEIKVW